MIVSTEKVPSDATFFGAQYLSYNLSSRGNVLDSNQDQVSLDFRTKQADGLLFYTGTSLLGLTHPSYITHSACFIHRYVFKGPNPPFLHHPQRMLLFIHRYVFNGPDLPLLHHPLCMLHTQVRLYWA